MKTKILKLNDGDTVNGTSFHDSTVSTTVSVLKKIIGKPNYGDNDGQDKVNFSWNRKLEDGTIFTVYDYKENRVLDENEVVEWHIGGYDGASTRKAEIALKDTICEETGKWTMPNWMEKYRDHFSNTGGNSIEDLMNSSVTVFSNAPLAMISACCHAQVQLLNQLRNKNIIQ